MNITNKDFKIFHRPVGAKRSNPIGAGRLVEVLGLGNAITAITKALKSKDDKITVKFRSAGRIDFYRK